MDELFRRAASALARAESLVITAGAGMGVDSGLPDFRGDQGFWKAYPPFARLGLGFRDLANPRWFEQDPELAWGFYGHRLHLYRDTSPHAGFEVLLRWLRGLSRGGFVFTSNVDGQFQKAGFDDECVEECHGSIHHLQCTVPCCGAIHEASEVVVSVDESTMRARPPLPTCPACGRLARPNILMFGDYGWLDDRSSEQGRRFRRWLGGRPLGSMVVVECGAGRAIPTVRYTSEQLAAGGAVLVRINPREPEVPEGQIGLPLGSREALLRIDEELQR